MSSGRARLGTEARSVRYDGQGSHGSGQAGHRREGGPTVRAAPERLQASVSKVQRNTCGYYEMIVIGGQSDITLVERVGGWEA
jgi:hypothetical protein